MNTKLLAAGAALSNAKLALILVHGRGATAESMLPLFEELESSEVAALFPQAPGGAWYPHSFLAPIAVNEPALSRSLQLLGETVETALSHGIPGERIALLGFSQGACLVSEFIARNPKRYAAVMVFTGGLIGPPGTERDYQGSLEGTPVFIGSSDPDPHVPVPRIRETEEVLGKMGAQVEVRLYPGMPHTINHDEIEVARSLLNKVPLS